MLITLSLRKVSNYMEYVSKEEKDKKVISFLVENRFRFYRHVFFSIGLLALFYLSSLNNGVEEAHKWTRTFLIYIIFLVMFYINIYVLVPRLFFRSKYLLYILCLVVMVLSGINVLSFILMNYFEIPEEIPSQNNLVKNMYDGMMISIPVIMVTTTIKLLQRWVKDNERISELKNLTLSMELNELKNQINPHFLFNMLNNVKALIRKDPEKATKIIIKLSEFLRYQLYENNEEKTSLHSEINFISNFLNLAKIRRDNFRFEVEFESEERKFFHVFIPPNLFTTFVENAVKHSSFITDKEVYINIILKIDDSKLYFTCINSKPAKILNQNKKYSGLGLANIRRRLELLYEDKYSLHIESTDELYTIKLIIPL